MAHQRSEPEQEALHLNRRPARRPAGGAAALLAALTMASAVWGIDLESQAPGAVRPAAHGAPPAAAEIDPAAASAPTSGASELEQTDLPEPGPQPPAAADNPFDYEVPAPAAGEPYFAIITKMGLGLALVIALVMVTVWLLRKSAVGQRMGGTGGCPGAGALLPGTKESDLPGRDR